MSQENEISSLVKIMEILRSPGGCPWDLKQNHASLKPYLIEECYECLEAIDKGDDDHLKEELGDVLLQVIFHAQIASERKAFDFDDVEKSICEKMVRRHPHVFGDIQVSNADDVARQWDEIKQSEKGDPSKENKSLDEGVPNALPAIQKALKIQQRAAKRGFEWPSIKGVFSKLKEELAELEEAVHEKDQKEIEAELGDLFFVLLKASRFLKVDPEKALNKTSDKFVHRFRNMEEALNEHGDKVETASIDRLTEFWNHAKAKDKKDE